MLSNLPVALSRLIEFRPPPPRICGDSAIDHEPADLEVVFPGATIESLGVGVRTQRAFDVSPPHPPGRHRQHAIQAADGAIVSRAKTESTAACTGAIGAAARGLAQAGSTPARRQSDAKR